MTFDGAAANLDVAGLKTEIFEVKAELKTDIVRLETKFSAMFAVQVLILGILLAEFIKPLF